MPYDFLFDIHKHFQKGAPRELGRREMEALELPHHFAKGRSFESHWEIPLKNETIFRRLFIRYLDACVKMEQAGIKSELSVHPKKLDAAVLTLATESPKPKKIRNITDATDRWQKMPETG